ncbi:MAG TPA: alpha/beta hydrolase [Gammaproteobacteria bacterium]|nr:alpha/beta hydrolase [Gammaproteobacteria bacterium]
MRTSQIVAGIAIFGLSAVCVAQPPGITREMINTTLPLEGAPLAVPGPYEVEFTPAFGSPRHVIYRPADLDAFPGEDSLPVMVWGNGGCAINGTRYGEFLTTIASHGFLVMTTVALEGEERRQQSVADLGAALDWAETENARSGSPLRGRIATDRMAVMGQSCGGFLSVALGTDPRVGTIGVFNSGVEAPDGDTDRPFATSDSLADLHGPVLFVNGHDRDFMTERSRANFDAIEHVPAFYGARHDAGHTATVFHPGGGEYANVAANWLKYVFKEDAAAGRMFAGSDCSLCTNPNWDTAAKRLE